MSLLFLTLLGTVLTLQQFRKTPRKNALYACTPISVLKPLKGAEQGLRENLESFFQLQYPQFELLFSIADPQDPARAIVEDLQKKYPLVASKLFVGKTPIGPNPKINNLLNAYHQAKHDWILISDSTIRVAPETLCNMAPHLQASTGVVTGVVVGSKPKALGGHLEALHLNTFCARGLLLADYFGHPCVMGKSMLLRRTTANRFGGIQILKNYLAEDYMTSQAIQHLGLKVVTLNQPINQHIDRYSFKQFWSRHIRWGRIRKCHAPHAFLLELASSSLLAGLMGAWAASQLLTISLSTFFLAHLVTWLCCDIATIYGLGQKVKLQTLLAWLIRETLHVPLWVVTLSTNRIEWHGHRFRLQRGGLIEAAT